MQIPKFTTLLSEPRLMLLMEKAYLARTIRGVGLELGVYQGGSLARPAMIMAPTPMYGIDTFDGMPEPGPNDLHNQGDFTHSDKEQIARKLNQLPQVQVILVKGQWPDAALAACPELEQQTFSYVHLDMDLYQPTLSALEWCLPRMAHGGWLVLDDYSNRFQRCPGIKMAVREFLPTWIEAGVCMGWEEITGQYSILKM